ncbi:hypothetical protein D9757_009174 [Collybiopsis confluens]|uniref:TPR-like protein n=1 Tax=Collybiopsis confluens TaxID=2823264 RepID=A0A8H5H879_9AGAR|nr:hypothetical protein D9757_009174 [Collybiopsis confluens]
MASFYDIAIDNGMPEGTAWSSGLRWLAKNKEDWMLLYDNADDPGISLGNFLPSCNHGNIIITTRNSHLQQLALQSCELRDMAEDDGIRLLLKHAIKGRELTAEQKLEAASIAQKLQYFALALVHAGAYISQLNCLDSYLNIYEKHHSKLMSENLLQSSDNYSIAVYATWDLSWSQLNEECRALLGICSCLHYERIPREIFQRAMEALGKYKIPDDQIIKLKSYDLLRVLTAETFKWDDFRMNHIIRSITSYSLLTIDKNNTYSLHPLIFQWIRDRKDIIKNDTLIEQVQSFVALAISDADIAFLQSLVPHCINFPVTGDAQSDSNLGYLWHQCGYYIHSLVFWEPLLEKTRKKLGSSNVATLNCMHDVIRSLVALGKFEKALQVADPLVKMSEELLGKLDLGTLEAMQNLAFIYSQLGNISKALEIEMPLLDTKQKLFGKQHPATFEATHNLAARYCDLAKYIEAKELAEPLVNLSRKVLGEKHPDTLSRLHLLGRIYWEMGNYNDALELAEPLLETSREIFGEQHPKTLSQMGQLRIIYSKLGQYGKAIELSESLIYLSKQTLGDNHPVTLMRQNILTNTHSSSYSPGYCIDLYGSSYHFQLRKPVVIE